jgi:hypothetical protein
VNWLCWLGFHDMRTSRTVTRFEVRGREIFVREHSWTGCVRCRFADTKERT